MCQPLSLGAGTGTFSDADEASWNAHPEALAACQHEVGAQEDGFFWMPFEEFRKGFRKFHINFQPKVADGGSGEQMLRFDEIEDGHTFSEDQLIVDGHAWDTQADDDADSEAGPDEATGASPEELQQEIDQLLDRLKTAQALLRDLQPGDERKVVLRSINRKRRRIAAAPVLSL